MNLSGKFIPKFSSLHGFTCCIVVIFIFFITNKGYCQTDISRNVSGQGINDDHIRRDTSVVVADSLGTDSLSTNDSLARRTPVDTSSTSRRKQLEESLGIKISKDALPSVVKSESRDSAVMDLRSNLFYSYGKAQVNYEDLQLNAGQITYQQSTNVVSAAPYEAAKDSSEKQTFSQGKEKFTYDSLQYNFKSKRAIVRNVHSQYGEGFVHSEQVKRNPDQTIYGSHSIYTTCALDTPHFGIYADRIKVIPGRVIISGAANLRIESVPTPLFLPFGLFPVSQKQKSGFVLPTYTVEQNRGLGLLNGGYYVYINDHVDFLTQTNIYTKGSYGISGLSNYSNIYHYSGAVNFSYAYNKTGEDFEPTGGVKKDFMLNWRHQSDGKSVPGQSFNASVQAGTSSFYSNNSYDPNQMLQNQYQSNITYAKQWQGTPLGMTISALHNQNTATKLVNVTLPSLNFYVSQVSPFQNKNAVGSHWYDKITTSYSVDMLNRTSFYDTAFNLNRLSVNDFQTGLKHSVPVNASYTIMRYINMSFGVNYNEYWFTEKLYQQYNDLDRKLDTVGPTRGFYTARQFDAGVTFTTRIYGMKMFKKGGLKGIRHVVTPSVGLSYHPDFGMAPFDYYYRMRTDSLNNYRYETPYITSVVGYPPLGKAGRINLGVGNNLQIKVRSAKDTVSGYKNVVLIDGLSFATAYNAVVDSYRWDPVRVDFRTNIMDKISVTSNAVFEPYAFDYDLGRRIPTTMYERGEGLARFRSASMGVGSNFHSKPVGGGPNPTKNEEYARIVRSAGYSDYVDFNIPWSFNISYSLNANNNYSAFSKKDTIVLNHTLTFAGELLLTKRWKLSVNSGYNFEFKQLTQTNIILNRDLHCWAMSLQTIPFGPRKSYSFTLNVKSAILQDLKLLKRRDFRDSPN